MCNVCVCLCVYHIYGRGSVCYGVLWYLHQHLAPGKNVRPWKSVGCVRCLVCVWRKNMVIFMLRIPAKIQRRADA